MSWLKTNRQLRKELDEAQEKIRLAYVRIDRNNTTISNLRQMLSDERRSSESNLTRAMQVIKRLEEELAKRGYPLKVPPSVPATPRRPAGNVVTMPSRRVDEDAPLINYGSSPDLSSMMIAASSLSDSPRPAEAPAPSVSSGGGGDFGGGGASSSWSSSDSSSSSSDSGSSSSGSD